MKHSRHGHHHFVGYPATLRQKIWALVLVPLGIVALVAILAGVFPYVAAPVGAPPSFGMIVIAALHTLARLFIAYFFAVVCAAPLAILVTSSKRVEEFLLPVFDIMQSVPILALFPVVIMIFINDFHSLNGAAIMILFLSMVWNIVFTLVGGLKIIPGDIIAAAEVFGVKGFSLMRRVIMPALVPQFVTGSIIALASGWNIVIVAEVLRTYIPGGTSAQDLFGVGSILVDASANAQTVVFIEAVFVMVVIIGCFNLLVWQHLLRFAQRFRFD